MRSWLCFALLIGCSDPAADAPTVAFELDAELAGEQFWDLPWPSDLRLTADGTPDLAGFPNPRDLPVVEELLVTARQRAGFPVMPIAWFKFTGEPPVYAITDAMTDGPAMLIGLDDGAQVPVVAQTLPRDPFTGDGLVGVAPRPGIVLDGYKRYAFVLRREFAPGVAVPKAFAELAADRAPAGARGEAARELYADLWPALEQAGVDRDDVLVATVFTTGDEVEVLRQRSEAVRGRDRATIANLRVEGVHDGFCALVGDATLPTYQVGTPPFNKEGEIELVDGAPVAQGEITVPLRITLPRGTMPAAGWPLWQFFHGSGGASFDLVDDGPSATPDGAPQAGEGPGAVVARHGIAAASSALPLNPERQPGASNYEYLNLNNLSAFPSTFQQGVFEQRLLLDALVELAIDPAVIGECPGLALPQGAAAHRFDAQKLVAGGHSMGGMYTNMIAAVEPRFGAVTPFGAGGMWNMMILDTEIVPDARDLLAGILGVDPEPLTFVHPALALINLGWEIAEPVTSMARLQPRPVYQPIGMDDKFFSNPVFDAAALAYGHRQAGELVWPETQEVLGLVGRDGLMTYPVHGGAVVQYTDGGILDAHYIHRQLPAVKHQYGCFLETFLRDGAAVIPAPDAPCP